MSTPLLRNMSVAPKTTISHTGTGLGHRLIVELPVEVTALDPDSLLKLMAKLPRSLRRLPSEEALRQSIELVADSLDLPPAAPVRQDIDVPNDRVTTCQDMAAIIAILAKSSDRLYLRDKDPILSGIRSGRRLVLVLPDKRGRNLR